MASIKFFLDKPLASRPTQAVYLRYKTVAPTKGTISFFPEQPVLVRTDRWDQKAQRVRGTSLEVQKINGVLRALFEKVSKGVEDLRGTGDGVTSPPDPSCAQLAAHLGHAKRSARVGHVGSAPTATASTVALPLTLPDVLLYSITMRQHELRASTIKEYQKTRRILLRFQPAGNPTWTLSRLLPEHLQQWRQWLVGDAAQAGADVDNQTANSQLTVVTTAVRYYRRLGGRVAQRLLTEEHLAVLLERFRVHKRRRNFLSREEMLHFYRAPVHPRSRATLLLVRDVYCLGWCTSLRQSDLFTLLRGNVHRNADGTPVALDTTSIKSLKITRLPLNSLAADIIKRWQQREPVPGYGGSATEWHQELARLEWPEDQLFPRLRSGSGRRKLLRELWQQLGLFAEPVEVVRVSGGRQTRKLVPRYELLSLHTARHGFGNHMATSNVPIEDTKLLMGHTSSKTTELYYQRDHQQAFDRAARALGDNLND